MIKTPLSTMIGGAFWTPCATILGSSSQNLTQLIKSLFANQEQGFAYDPNDLTTLYQDAAGTIPVTSVGQPVGLMLDKSKGLSLGVELVVNGNFESGLIVTKTDGLGSVSTWGLNAVSPLSGTQDGLLEITTSTTGRPTLSTPNTGKIIGALYELSFDYKIVSGEIGILAIYNGGSSVPVNTKLDNQGKFTRRYICAGTDAREIIYFGNYIGAIQIDNISVKQVLGNHAYQTVSASRPILQRNATTGAYYLAFDGADDFLVTNNIDFTATDKVSLFAGVRKLSDASTGILVELSMNSDIQVGAGYFRVSAPAYSGAIKYAASSRGTVGEIVSAATTDVVFNAPNSAVLAAKLQISTDTAVLRLNSVQVAQSSTDQGTGNYGNYPVYIGRRGGASLPFNGHLYGLIGIGRLTTDAETIALEKSIAKNTGVTLSV